MPRIRLACLLAVVLAAPAAAQDQPVTRPPEQPVGTMLPVPPLPRIGLPLPQIALPAPAPSRADRPSSRQIEPRVTQGRTSRQGPLRRGGERGTALLPVYVAPLYLIEPVLVAPAAAPPAAPDAVAPESATLRLEVDPAVESQVYVDGYYIGITDGSDSFELTAGAHRVELRSRGYEPLAFDVRLSTRQPVIYRDRLTAAATTPDRTVAPSPGPPMTLYVIPGCYAGNVPPDSTQLPSGCDKSRTTTVPR